jgi:hypothetical protein
MFNRNRIEMSRAKAINPTSKMSLKMSCIQIADGDIEKAERIYDFFAKDMTLPDNDPIEPTTIDRIKTTAGELFSLYKENKDDIAQGIAMIRALRGGAAPSAPANIPELPK